MFNYRNLKLLPRHSVKVKNCIIETGRGRGTKEFREGQGKMKIIRALNSLPKFSQECLNLYVFQLFKNWEKILFLLSITRY